MMNIWVACELFAEARKEQKSILFFVHGYNNEVGSAHSYYRGDAMKNDALKEMFTEMFNGRPVEGLLKYHSDNNSYKFK